MRSIFRDEMKFISSFDRLTKERFLGEEGSICLLTRLILALLFGPGDICEFGPGLGLKPCMVAANYLWFILYFESEFLIVKREGFKI